MANPRVLIADAVSLDCDTILRSRSIEVTRAVGLSPAELGEMVADYDGMIVRSAVKVDRPMIERMNGMRAIGRAGTGVDNIDVEAATERGIIVMNVPEGNTISAAEHAVALLLSLMRQIPAANASIRDGKWDRKSFTGSEVLEKRVGILGMGRIGREVATRLRAFGATIIGHDPVLTADAVQSLGAQPVTFDELIETADIISIHIPLLPETRGLIGHAELGRMREGAIIVNAARGGIVDETALLEALNTGRIAGAAIDVFEKEPPALPNPLVDHPNVVATPHIAASTREAQERVAIAIAHQLAEYFEGAGARGVVNARGLEGSLGRDAMPLMDAASTLGLLLGQLVGTDNVGCRLTAYGADAAQIVRGLGASFLAGLFARIEPAANPINAELLAARHNVRVVTSGEGSHPSYTSLISAEVSSPTATRSAAATVFGHREVRIVALDGVMLDVKPEGTLLLFSNVDQPGVLAAVSGLLARHRINIANVSLGRREGAGKALTIIRIDNDMGDDVLAELSALEMVEGARVLRFPHDTEEA
jgi:D-3-phosphoglycerate dehydrogenase / 2-oxoglutarate reductase